MAKTEEQGQHMYICTVIVRLLNLRHRVYHLGFERSVESSFLPTEVTLDDGDSFGGKVKNPDPVYGVFFRPSQHNEPQNSLEGGGLA